MKKSETTKTGWIKNYKKILKDLNISYGSHTERESGVCIMEAVAWLRNQVHTDSPKCVSEFIRNIMISWNDNLESDTERNTYLKPLIPVIVKTKSTATVEKKRKKYLIEWAEKHYKNDPDSIQAIRDEEFDILFMHSTSENHIKFQSVIKKLAKIK